MICCSISNPPAPEPDWNKRWNGQDKGLICAWLQGIEKAKVEPALAHAAHRGELPICAFRGGVSKALRTKDKLGSLHYLAYRQGLLGEDLCVDQATETQLTCSLFGVVVTFTGDIAKLLAQADSDDGELL